MTCVYIYIYICIFLCIKIQEGVYRTLTPTKSKFNSKGAFTIGMYICMYVYKYTL